jgi:hypothetical protein
MATPAAEDLQCQTAEPICQPIENARFPEFSRIFRCLRPVDAADVTPRRANRSAEGHGHANRVSKGSKPFFFEKNNQKTFALCATQRSCRPRNPK